MKDGFNQKVEVTSKLFLLGILDDNITRGLKNNEDLREHSKVLVSYFSTGENGLQEILKRYATLDGEVQTAGIPGVFAIPNERNLTITDALNAITYKNKDCDTVFLIDLCYNELTEDKVLYALFTRFLHYCLVNKIELSYGKNLVIKSDGYITSLNRKEIDKRIFLINKLIKHEKNRLKRAGS